jgi:hypothetical protein
MKTSYFSRIDCLHGFKRHFNCFLLKIRIVCLDFENQQSELVSIFLILDESKTDTPFVVTVQKHFVKAVNFQTDVSAANN